MATLTTGHCTLVFTAAEAGAQTLTAVYAGGVNDATSTSAPYGITVP